MLTPEQQEKLARAKEAMERVKTGASESEVVELPSGGRVRVVRDSTTPGNIAIEPLDEQGEDVVREVSPEQKAAMERARAAAERLRTGESDIEEVALASGDTLRLTRDPDVPGGFMAESDSGGPSIRSLTFEASPAQPDHYPADLPFLPDCPSALTEVGTKGHRTITWYNPPDPQAAFEAVQAQLRESGWEGGEGTNVSAPFGGSHWIGFRKGELQRALALNSFRETSTILLAETLFTSDED
jgi:hypothetical protein